MNILNEICRDFGDPLKHEARLKLWFPVLKDFQKRLGRKLKYFTLPGPKAYDVIKWKEEGLLKFDGRGFPEVCFCEIDPNNYINAKRILGNTRGIKGKFEDVIQNRKNPKYKAFWELFPYDVYNLDFCGTWFEGEEPFSETFISIIKLINTHVSRKKFSKFILLLTIRIDKTRINLQVISDLRNNLQENLSRPEFSKLSCVRDVDNFIRSNFPEFILISIPKLLASKIIPQTLRFSGKITGLKRAYYPRNKRFYIGKFVLIIDREKTSLRRNPKWYKEIVSESLNFENILKIKEDIIPEETKKDLRSLKQEIKRIENYDMQKNSFSRT